MNVCSPGRSEIPRRLSFQLSLTHTAGSETLHHLHSPRWGSYLLDRTAGVWRGSATWRRGNWGGEGRSWTTSHPLQLTPLGLTAGANQGLQHYLPLWFGGKHSNFLATKHIPCERVSSLYSVTGTKTGSPGFYLKICMGWGEGITEREGARAPLRDWPPRERGGDLHPLPPTTASLLPLPQGRSLFFKIAFL